MAAGTASAQVVTSETGTVYTTSGLSTVDTRGADMVGMEVTGYYQDGSGFSSITGTWGDLGGSIFGVKNSFFYMYLGESVDTYNGYWSLFVQDADHPLSRIVLSGAPGNTVFDRSQGSDTPGSFSGKDFDYHYTVHPSTAVTYRNAVAIGSSTPQGDLYEQVEISFATPIDQRYNTGRFLQFNMDADNAEAGAVIVPADPTVAPEPVSMALLGTGLAGLGVVHRRRRRRPEAIEA